MSGGDWTPLLTGPGYGYVVQARPVSVERDLMYSRVFATPDGRVVLDDMRRDDPELVRLIEQRCDRMRHLYATGPHNDPTHPKGTA